MFLSQAAGDVVQQYSNAATHAADGQAGVLSATPSPSAGTPLAAGLAALCTVARLHHVAADAAHLAHQMGWAPSHRPSNQDLLLAARLLGLKAQLTCSVAGRLSLVALPALALLKDESGKPRVVVLAQCDGQRVLFQDRRTGAEVGHAARFRGPGNDISVSASICAA